MVMAALRHWSIAAPSSEAAGYDVYGCAGFLATDTETCAMVNRGVKDSATADPALYYQLKAQDGSALYNPYAAMVHSLCGADVYGFPYDDVGRHGGLLACNGPTTLTFCPGDQ